jgi:putative membrane protein
MMAYGRGFGMSAFGLLWLLGVAIFLAVVVVVVVLAVRYVNRTNPPAQVHWPGQDAVPPPAARPEPLEILRERFARGEITLDEFETAKRALGYPSSPPPPPGPS